MMYPIPIQVHVIWHPASEKLCRPLAEHIYTTLNRDPDRPLLPGIGMPVFFRCVGADVADPMGVPLPISILDTKLDLRIALITADFIVDDVWRDYLWANSREIRAKSDRGVFLPVDLSGARLEDKRLTVRLDPEDPALAEKLMQHVLLQCCRLLGGRVSGRGDNQGAAPLKLFLSHTKRDEEGLKIATEVKRYLDWLAVDRFFDEVSIQPGDELTPALREAIAESALVCIRSDNYVSSYWCRAELSFAKRNHRPMVVIDALSRREPRSSTLLTHLPGVRLSADALDSSKMEAAINFVILEIVRFLYANQQLNLLQLAGFISGDVVLVTRPPELRDVVATISRRLPNDTPPIFLYPDPIMPAEEAEEFAPLDVVTATPTSFWRERLDGVRIGLSLSPGEEGELRALGLGSHVEDAMRVVARQLLAAGAILHYGGALFPGALTETLFEMIGAYSKDGVKLPPLVNHSAWPLWQEIDNKWLAARMQRLKMERSKAPPDALAFSDTDGPGHAKRLQQTRQGRYALGRSLTQMRRDIARSTQVRIVLGSKVHSFMGFYPGILEEVSQAIEAGQVVFVLGGFGGASRLVTSAIAGEKPVEFTRRWQESRSAAYRDTLAFYDEKRATEPQLSLPAIDYDGLVDGLGEHGVAGLGAANGLSDEENRFLFRTASIDASLYLIMKGLMSVRSRL